MARTHVLLGIWLQLVHALVLEASWTVYLMSTLEHRSVPAASHSSGEGTNTLKLLLKDFHLIPFSAHRFMAILQYTIQILSQLPVKSIA